MPGMTAENRKLLDDSITEYGASLDRVLGEKEHQKALAEKMKVMLNIQPAHFVKVATAYWKGSAELERKRAEDQYDLFVLAQGVVDGDGGLSE